MVNTRNDTKMRPTNSQLTLVPYYNSVKAAETERDRRYGKNALEN